MRRDRARRGEDQGDQQGQSEDRTTETAKRVRRLARAGPGGNRCHTNYIGAFPAGLDTAGWDTRRFVLA